MIQDFYHWYFCQWSFINFYIFFQLFFAINIVVNILKLISNSFYSNVYHKCLIKVLFLRTLFLKNNIFETFETPFPLTERFPQIDFSKHQFSQYHYANSRTSAMLTDFIPENLSHFAYSYSRPSMTLYLFFSRECSRQRTLLSEKTKIQQYDRHMSLIFFVYSYLSKLP